MARNVRPRSEKPSKMPARWDRMRREHAKKIEQQKLRVREEQSGRGNRVWRRDPKSGRVEEPYAGWNGI